MSRIRTLVATEILMLLGLAGLVGISYLVERVAGLDEAVPFAPVPAIILAACPALLWLGYFYAQDRHEPEPKHFVFGVFLVGAFIAGPAVAFLRTQLLPPEHFAAPHFQPFAPERLILSFGIIGLAQELAKYAAVRYSVYLSPEFDEPLDGVIYMTAAGVGFATYENILFLRGHEGEVFLSAGVARVVVTVLAHACFAGVLGYALGRAKFADVTPVVRGVILTVGLVIATGLNGAFQLASDVVVVTGLAVTPWRAVIFGFGFAAVIFLILSILIQRLLALSPHQP